MPYKLVVTKPFGDYAVGAGITDQVEIDRILAPGHSHNVVRVWEPDPEPKQPEPEPAFEEKSVKKAETKIDPKA